jgi:hypothetical protein
LVPLTGGTNPTKEESMQNDKADTKDRPFNEQDRPRHEQDRSREPVGKSHEGKDDKPKKPTSEQATHQGGGGVNKDHKPHGPGADR